MSGESPLPIVMCLWQRPHLLEFNLQQILEQEGSYQVHLWNNNADPEVKRLTDAAAERHADLVQSVTHSRVNERGWGRYMAASALAANGVEQVMFLDDDVLLAPGTLLRLASHAAPETIASMWAWTIRGDYWDRVRTPEGDVPTYCGTGGMVADTAIFTARELLAYPHPACREFMEDLWLSHVAQQLGWRLVSAGEAGFALREDGMDQSVGRRLEKSAVLDLLREGERGPRARQRSQGAGA